MKNASGFEEVAHTADWALRVWAPDMTRVMLSAVKGMYALSEMIFSEEIERRINFSVQAIDEGSLLVEFLNEVLFYADYDSLGLDEIVLRRDGFTVEVEGNGRVILERKKEIKAVTYHNLQINHSEHGLETVLVFDV